MGCRIWGSSGLKLLNNHPEIEMTETQDLNDSDEGSAQTLHTQTCKRAKM